MDYPPKKLLDQVRDALRSKHYSYRTEQSYVQWVKRYVLFHNKRHPRELGRADVEAFLTHLAVERHVAASTQNQARGALLFLYRHVLHLPLVAPDDIVSAKRPHHLPAVLTWDEVQAVLAHLTGTPHLVATLLYGGGLRLIECLRLRVKDVDIAQRQIMCAMAKARKIA